MTAKATSRVDKMGRIVIPAHIRKELLLNTGTVVTIAVDSNGAMRVEPMNERRCSICGESVEAAHRIPVTVGPYEKFVCVHCANAISRAGKAVR